MNAAVSKTVSGGIRPTRVRIPPPPFKGQSGLLSGLFWPQKRLDQAKARLVRTFSGSVHPATRCEPPLIRTFSVNGLTKPLAPAGASESEGQVRQRALPTPASRRFAGFGAAPGRNRIGRYRPACVYVGVRIPPGCGPYPVRNGVLIAFRQSACGRVRRSGGLRDLLRVGDQTRGTISAPPDATVRNSLQPAALNPRLSRS